MKLGIIVAGVVVLLSAWLWNLSLVPHATADDGFIYVRYAMNWVDHGELTWNVGQRGADGFTSMAFQVLSALAYRVHRSDPVSAVCGAGLLTASATIVAAMVLPVVRAGRDRLPLAAGMALLGATATSALVPQFAYWSTSLLDVPLVAIAVLLASHGAPAVFGRHSTPSQAILGGLALALLSVTRPEGMLVSFVVVILAVACAAWSLGHDDPGRVRSVAAGVLAFALPVTSYLLWHRIHFGHLFPNPVYVKTGVTFSWEALGRGVQYWMDGPVGGLTPNGVMRPGVGGMAEHVPGRVVHDAITPLGTSWPLRLLVLIAPLLWLSTWAKRLYRSHALAIELRISLLVPLGMIGLVLLAGGDRLFNGWRMFVPIVPAVGMAMSRAAVAVRHRAAALALLVIAGSAATALVLAMASRPATCAAAAEACGVDALRRLPMSSLEATWDTTSAIEDRECATAIADAFPPSIVVGQSDYLRISRWIRGPILDLSGLVNGNLAHEPHQPWTSLFSIPALLASKPDIYFYGWTFVSPTPVSTTRLDGDATRAAFRPLFGRIASPWPPDGITPQDLSALTELYSGASVQLSSGLYCNFFVRRDAVSTMRPSPRISVGP